MWRVDRMPTSESAGELSGNTVAGPDELHPLTSTDKNAAAKNDFFMYLT